MRALVDFSSPTNKGPIFEIEYDRLSSDVIDLHGVYVTTQDDLKPWYVAQHTRFVNIIDYLSEWTLGEIQHMIIEGKITELPDDNGIPF